MGRIGKGKALVGVNLPKATVAIIDGRADALNLTRSTYAALIFEKWVADGYPPVTEPDRLLQVAKTEKSSRKAG